MLKVELVDIAFAVDAILAAVTLTVALPESVMRIFCLPVTRFIRHFETGIYHSEANTALKEIQRQ